MRPSGEEADASGGSTDTNANEYRSRAIPLPAYRRSRVQPMLLSSLQLLWWLLSLSLVVTIFLDCGLFTTITAIA